MEIYKAKQALRKDMASRKKEYSTTTLCSFSDKIMEHLEQTQVFHDASCLAIYHAIPGEVQTASFIEKWYTKKKILLPVIDGDDLRLLPYSGNDSLKPGIFGILEPNPDSPTTAEEEIDLIVVPGVAFDRKRNRMGRGKGYYDRLLANLQAPKVGICFGFQLLPSIPTEPFDKKMDSIITEEGVI